MRRFSQRSLLVQAGMVALALIGLAVVLLVRSALGSTGLPTVRSLRMPIPRVALDRTLTIGPQPGVQVGDRMRLAVDRYGQFRGHWWWNNGWVYVSGKALPGSRIHVHIDTKSLAITEIPDPDGVAGVRRYGTKAIIGDDIQVDVIKFGIGAELFMTRTASGPFAGRQVLDQIQGRAWTSRGLTITRDQVTSTPANDFPCMLMRPVADWDLGCRLLGQPRLVSDRRGRFASSPDLVVSADRVSLTPTPNNRTQLPTDSMRVAW